MKDSGIPWLGEIPSHWQVARLKDIKANKPYAIVDGPFGSAISTEDYRDEGVPLVRIVNLTGMFVDNSSTMYISPELAKSVDRSAFSLQDIIFAKTGATVGKCSINNSIEYGILSSSCVKISLNSALNNHFYYYYFYTNQFNLALKLACGGSTRDTINLAPFSTLPCIIPPIEEQNRIANYLDKKCVKIDEMILLQEQIVEELKAYKQSVITEVVCRGLTPYVGMKDSGVEWIGRIPRVSEVIKLKFISSISRGLFNHRPRNDERFYGGEYPFIQTGDVAQSGKYITRYSQTLSELGKSVSKLFPRGTMTMTIAANVGDVAILDFDAYFPDSVLGIVPRDNVWKDYLYYAIVASKTALVNAATINTQMNLNVQSVGNTLVPLHPFEEQVAIADYLDSKCVEIDNIISVQKSKIDALKEYKKSFIFEYITGKKEIPA